MGTQTIDMTEALSTRGRSWRDDLATDYEITQAKLRFDLALADGVEEYI